MNLEAYLFFPGNTEEAMNLLPAHPRWRAVDHPPRRRRPDGVRGREAPRHQRRPGHRNVHAAGERPGRRHERRPDQDRADHHRDRRGRPAQDLRCAERGRDREGPPGEDVLGRHLRRPHRQVRYRLAGQHHGQLRTPDTTSERATAARPRRSTIVADQSAPWPKQGPGVVLPFDREEVRPLDRGVAEDHRRLRTREAHGDRRPPQVRVRDGTRSCQRARRVDARG